LERKFGLTKIEEIYSFRWLKITKVKDNFEYFCAKCGILSRDPDPNPSLVKMMLSYLYRYGSAATLLDNTVDHLCHFYLPVSRRRF